MKLKYGAGIVIKPAHDSGVDCIFDIHSVEVFFDAFKMLFALIAEIVEHYGSIGGYC